jgi:predicted metal-dependent phosphoesterase TrpH
VGKADLHIHSTWSDGMATVPELLTFAEEQTDLDVVAISDHDQIRGALEAVEWCAGRPGGRVQAIVATEISAAWGRHVLAFFFAPPFPTQPLPRFRSLSRTVGAVRDAGGVIAVPHPLSALVPSVGRRTFTNLLEQVAEAGGVEAMEVCSGVVGGRRAEARLRQLNTAEWHLAVLGSSDAHHRSQVGSAYTVFTGTTPADLRRSIAERTTEARWGNAPPIPPGALVRQGWRALVKKPAKELRVFAGTLAQRRARPER